MDFSRLPPYRGLDEGVTGGYGQSSDRDPWVVALWGVVTVSIVVLGGAVLLFLVFWLTKPMLAPL